ncbi:MAG TPA: AP protein, partial [Verrucomicrobiota bacterium]|nr:AP protein [Verrucomicrobiota bacterium]
RYDNYRHAAHRVDDYIRRIWETVQSLPEYRDRTTLIITTDHGRGSGLQDWRDHNAAIDGAENVWLAFLGPDTPAFGERTNTERLTLSRIAATLAAFLGEDYHAAVPQSGPVIDEVLPKRN